MPLIGFLLAAVAIYVIPVWLVRSKAAARAQNFFVSSERTPLGVIRNSAIAYAVQTASFGTFFAWGAGGDFWPAIINAVCFGAGTYLIYILRRPIVEFMGRALMREEDLALELVQSLTDEQRALAVFDKNAPKEIITAESRKAALSGQPGGLPFSKMSSKQKEMLGQLVAEYASNFPAPIADMRLELNFFPVAHDLVRDLGVAGIGQRALGPGDVVEVVPPLERP